MGRRHRHGFHGRLTCPCGAKLVTLSAFQAFELFGLLFSSAAVLFFIFVYRTGTIALELCIRGFGINRPTGWDHIIIRFLAGASLFPQIACVLGLLGLFGPWALGIWAACLAAACWGLRISFFPSRESLRLIALSAVGDTWCLAALVTSTCLLGLCAALHLIGWMDGNFVIAAAHLAKTGLLLPRLSDGQFGMVALTALTTMIFPKMSVLNSMVAWGPFYAPFLFFGMREMIRETFGKGPIERFAILIFLFPLAFKSQEIRGSVTGFGFALWSMAFFSRAMREKNIIPILGSSLALGCSLLYGQISLLFVLPYLFVTMTSEWVNGIFSSVVSGLRVLLLSGLIHFPLIALSFYWVMGSHGALWPAIMIPFAGIVLVWAIAVALTNASPHYNSKREWPVLAVLTLAVAGVAFAFNPPWNPTYNWYFFIQPVSFLFLNFSSYGLLGYLYALALILAIFGFLIRWKEKAQTVLLVGFFVACAVQILSPVMFKSGISISTDRAFILDIWKDATLFWACPFMVIGISWLWSLGARHIHLLQKNAASGIVAWAFFLIPTQNLNPYRALIGGWGIRAYFFEQMLPYTSMPWRGQQVTTAPLYIVFALDWLNEYSIGERLQKKDCRLCTIHAIGFMLGEGDASELLINAPLEPGEGFLTADASLGLEVYMGRALHYESGINTFNPLYLSYLNAVTMYEFYWKPGNRIRRAPFNGMAYTITDPDRHLVHIKMQAKQEGIETGKFQVPKGMRYHLYKGKDGGPQSLEAHLDSQLLGDPSPIGFDLGFLVPGRTYSIELRSKFDQPDNDLDALVFPWRDWEVEQIAFSFGGPNHSALGLMKYSGVPAAHVPMEDFRRIWTTTSSSERLDLLNRYKIRYILHGEAVERMFTGARARLDSDPGLKSMAELPGAYAVVR